MSIAVDMKYASLLGGYLENYKKLDTYLYNFRCPICGDSKKNKFKSRGYIYKIKDQLNVKCHNCNYSAKLNTFIKTVNISLYNEYLLDSIGDTSKFTYEDKLEELLTKPLIIKEQVLLGLKRLDTLPLSHPAIKYIINRKIPRKYWELFFFTPKFKKYINSIDSSKFVDDVNDYPRLIIPYYNSESICFGLSARAFGNEDPKYYNMKFGEEEFVYGLERINKNDRIYCVEGPIDSLFLPNSIATSGTSFNKPIIQELKANLVIIPDNEPRSPILTKLVENVIDNGFNVVLFPDSFQYKDINKAITEGISQELIIDIIEANISNGLTAKLKYNNWKKC